MTHLSRTNSRVIESTADNRAERSRELGDFAFLKSEVSRPLLLTAIGLAVFYFIVLAFWFQRGNLHLFTILLIGQLFHLWQLFMYIFTVWGTNYKPQQKLDFSELVDVFITVAGEPVDIVRETVQAAKAMRYPNFKIFILNDGFVAKKDNWQEMEELAKQERVNCITRRTPGGAKAGNINNALRQTNSPYVVIFDADHVPHEDFLAKTMPYFGDEKMGYVQTPQYYKNQEMNMITKGSWEQQALFFGPICKGKNRHNSATMCGTNMVISRAAIEQVGGMYEKSIAEDFITGMMIHEKGWKSIYVSEVLAQGLAPEDFLSYYKQQFRWARGALDLFVRRNFLFRRGLTWQQKLQYLSSVSFFISGFVTLAYALIPVIFFFFGISPFHVSTMFLAAIFLPYIFLALYVLQQSSNFSFTYRSLAFSMAGFPIHIKAFWAMITNQKTQFSITPKRQQAGNFLNLVTPHIAYVCLVGFGIIYAIGREGFSPAVISNIAWASIYVAIFSEYIIAAMPEFRFASLRAKRLAPQTQEISQGLTARNN
jgi:cellulose synthase (UDP-forming)